MVGGITVDYWTKELMLSLFGSLSIWEICIVVGVN